LVFTEGIACKNRKNPRKNDIRFPEDVKIKVYRRKQSVDKFTIFTDFTVISLRFIPAFIGGDE